MKSVVRLGLTISPHTAIVDLMSLAIKHNMIMLPFFYEYQNGKEIP